MNNEVENLDVEAQAVVENFEQVTNNEPINDPGVEFKRVKKKSPIIPIVIVIALLAILGYLAYSFLLPSSKNVYKKIIEIAFDKITEVYDSSEGTAGFNGKLSFSVDEPSLKILDDYAIEYSGVKDSKNNISLGFKALEKNVEILGGDSFIFNDKIYLKSPKVYPKTLYADIEGYGDIVKELEETLKNFKGEIAELKLQALDELEEAKFKRKIGSSVYGFGCDHIMYDEENSSEIMHIYTDLFGKKIYGIEFHPDDEAILTLDLKGDFALIYTEEDIQLSVKEKNGVYTIDSNKYGEKLIDGTVTVDDKNVKANINYYEYNELYTTMDIDINILENTKDVQKYDMKISMDIEDMTFTVNNLITMTTKVEDVVVNEQYLENIEDLTEEETSFIQESITNIISKTEIYELIVGNISEQEY